MKNKRMWLIAVILCLPLIISSKAGAQEAARAAGVDFRGTWSGTFFSKHSNIAPFTLTVVIASNSEGRLVGNSSHNSSCLKDLQLQVTVTGSRIVLAGSDSDGDNITVRGTMDKTGTIVKSSYVLNGSATGQCETDDGAGTLAER
jgi:hypothetical protein